MTTAETLPNPVLIPAVAEKLKIKKPKAPKKPKAIKAPKPPKPPPRLYPEFFDGHQPPKAIWVNRSIGDKTYVDRKKQEHKGRLHLAGRGSKTSEIMFVSPCALWEEESMSWTTKPCLLNGPAGNLFLRCLGRSGIKDDAWFYTTLVKYNVPKLKPTKQDLRWCEAAVEEELTTIKPKLIVCLGAAVFAHFHPKPKLGLKEAQGAFFWSEKYNCALYPMDMITTPLLKPEYIERFMVDLKQVKQKLDELHGVQIAKVVQNYHVIEKAEQLGNLVADIRAKNTHWLAVDAEWAGQTYVSGKLRCFQKAWAPGQAACVKLMDEKQQYVFDQPLNVVGDIVRPLLSDPDLKLIGHNGAADAVWFEEHLGIDTYQRFGFDTMFAQHCINEYADMKLERLSVGLTDLGRYDIKLTLWKKETGFDEDDNEGYGKVPDRILIPYSIFDADTTLRVFPKLWKQLYQQRLNRYYFDVLLPFVTDGFVEMMKCGLPINMQTLDDMREAFTRNSGMLLEDLREKIKTEADGYLCRQMMATNPEMGRSTFLEMFNILKSEAKVKAPDGTELVDYHNPEYLKAVTHVTAVFKDFCGDAGTLARLLPYFEHWLQSVSFNMNSTDHLRRWFFQVKGFTPFKTTKKDGITMPWCKVELFPKERQHEFTPAADKSTIKVFAAQDKLVAQVEEMKAVSNIVKAFLKAPDEKGREQGIHKWVQTDGRVHANFSLTETHRPRSWKPNILNWPKTITKPLERGFERINLKLASKCRNDNAGKMSDAEIEKHVSYLMRSPTSLRACVDATTIPGEWCVVDQDLETAEVVALAYLSGDQAFINMLNDPDTQFARTSLENPKKGLRIAFNELSCYPQEAWDEKLIVGLDDPRLLRNESGHILHLKRDLHHELAEGVFGKPRELLNEDLARSGVGKVGNFCLAEGSLVTTARGEIPIEQVKLSDKLWDGEAWVDHEGVVCNGVKTVHLYQGLWATDNHEVWTAAGRKVTFGFARKYEITLARGAVAKTGSITAETHKFDCFSGDVTFGQKLVFGSGVPALRKAVRQIHCSTRARAITAMHMFEKRQLLGLEGLSFAQKIRVNEAALRARFACEFRSVQGPRDKSSIQLSSGVCNMGVGNLAEFGFQRFGVRSHRQQWPLLEGQSASDGPCDKYEQPSELSCGDIDSSQEVFTRAPRSDLRGAYVSALSTPRHECKGDSRKEQNQQTCGGLEETRTAREVKVYDILNVGPRHRFVCNGILVSNSIPYGASDSLLERMIESNTGIKPPEGTGARMIETFNTTRPDAARFLKEMEGIIEDPGYYRAITGAVRHFFMTEIAEVSGINEYTKEGLLSPLKRQARNYPMQHLVAVTTAKALIRFIKERRALGLKSRICMLLYDAISALAPLEEAKTASELLKHCLTDWNQWTVHGRTFNFGVDAKVSFRWGGKPTKEEKARIAEVMK